MKGLLSFLAMLLLLSSCTKKQHPLTEQEVLEVIKKFDEGWCNKNLKQVDETLAPSYIYFTQSGGLFSRDSLVQTAGAPTYVLDTMRRSALNVAIYQNTAVVSSRWMGKGVYKGTKFDEDQRCSIVIMKKENKVQILSEHCTPIKSVRLFH
jgi:hypothetical protein